MEVEPFVHFLRTASVAGYKVQTPYKEGELEYLGDGPIDGKYYGLSELSTLWVSSKGVITMIEFHVNQIEFKLYISANYGLKIFNLKRVLIFLEQQKIHWAIDEDWTYNKQLTVKVQSGVQLCFGLNKQMEYMLHKVLIAKNSY